MSWQVTLDIFSGRPNPSWQLAGEAAEALSRRLRAALVAPPGTPATPATPPDLGYRGFVIRRQAARGAAGEPAHGPAGEPAHQEELRIYGGWITGAERPRLDPERALERWLLESAGDRLERPVFEHVLHGIEGSV